MRTGQGKRAVRFTGSNDQLVLSPPSSNRLSYAISDRANCDHARSRAELAPLR